MKIYGKDFTEDDSICKVISVIQASSREFIQSNKINIPKNDIFNTPLTQARTKFIKNVILASDYSENILQNFESLYLLIVNTEKDFQNDDIHLKDILDEKEMEKTNFGLNCHIIGYSLFHLNDENTDIIQLDYFEILVHGHNFGELFLHQINKRYRNRYVILPYTPIISNEFYWAKKIEFQFMLLCEMVGMNEASEFCKQNLHWSSFLVSQILSKNKLFR
jgi:hypothetical protein